MTNYHLVIVKKPYLDAILADRKRIESRLSKTKPYSFGRVLAGDKLFLKESSGPVCATAMVATVKSFNNLTPKQITEIKQRYHRQRRILEKQKRLQVRLFGLAGKHKINQAGAN